ncbi:MAG: hypothetical protein ABI158_01865 [Edaphobacter sp.]
MMGTRLRVLVLAVALGWMTPAGWSQTGSGLRGHAKTQDAGPSSFSSTELVSSRDDAISRDADEVRPLPDTSVLMHEVETRQKAAETIQKDYLYHAADTIEELNGQGRVKKTRIREYDVFWTEGVPIHKLTSKDGKELSADGQRKELERIDKVVAKAREKRAKADAKGQTTDPYGNEEITVSRFLELGSFSNARRIKLNGRDTIAVDYAGNPQAKTRNRMEAVIRDMVGTVWVDEEDRALAKIEGHFLNTFKIGAGLVVNIQKGTNFSLEQRKINNEVWLPARIEGHGAARAFLLFKFNGSFREIDSDYRKFKVTTTILPGVGRVQDTK